MVRTLFSLARNRVSHNKVFAAQNQHNRHSFTQFSRNFCSLQSIPESFDNYSFSSIFPPLVVASSLLLSLNKIQNEEERELPVYKSSDVAKHNGKDSEVIWMSYAGSVYDVTHFIANHPGGKEKIMQAAGQPIEPYWNIYRQHFNTDLPSKIMETLLIGTLDSNDQDKIDDALSASYDENDPYQNEPDRHPALIMHGDQPANAEVPTNLITQSYLTPREYFYIRNHHPVPMIDVDTYFLEIDLTAMGERQKDIVKLSYKDITSLPSYDVTATLQCSGNRRSHYNAIQKTSGTAWDQGAISTAKWTGPKLRDVLKLAGLNAEKAESLNLDHVRLESVDGMKASIGLPKAISAFGDCIIAYQMNDEPLPRDHGFPVRLIVPGYAAVRNVKWLKRIEIAEAEAEGAWQRGLNYKILPVGVTDVNSVDLDDMPGLQEVSVFSGITNVEMVNEKKTKTTRGDEVYVNASGWAWAGGGRNIVRVDITGSNGKSWTPATITQGKHQKFNRAWAWVFWEAKNVPAKVLKDGKTVEIASKSIDASFNSQPEKCDHMWNVRGLANNSWYRYRLDTEKNERA